VPTLVGAASGTSFVKEGDPIPHRQFSFSGPQLAPRKFATLCSFTREIFEHSTPTIEALVRAALTESAGLALDVAMFSTTAGDSSRPPGLLQGIAALTPGTTMLADVATLAAAVSAVAANGEIVFICAPKQAAALRLQFGFPYAVLASSALADKTVIAVAVNAIASAVDPAPRFAIAKEAVVHEETVPLPFSTTGTPATVAAPQVSYFQSDLIGLKMIFEMSWLLRSSSGLAYMTAVTW
jgi:hypothetical protein